MTPRAISNTSLSSASFGDPSLDAWAVVDGGDNVALDGPRRATGSWLFSDSEHVVAPGKGQSRSLTDALEEVSTII